MRIIGLTRKEYQRDIELGKISSEDKIVICVDEDNEETWEKIVLEDITNMNILYSHNFSLYEKLFNKHYNYMKENHSLLTFAKRDIIINLMYEIISNDTIEASKRINMITRLYKALSHNDKEYIYRKIKKDLNIKLIKELIDKGEI